MQEVELTEAPWWKRRWPLLAVLAVVLAAAAGLGGVFAGGPSKVSLFAFNASDCNAIVGMSQARQVYSGTALQSPMPANSPLEAATGEQWMVLYKGGMELPYFMQASNWNLLSEAHRCGTDAEIDRVLFIFTPEGSTDLVGDLNLVLDITAAKYPNAEVDLSLLVGGEGHVVCQITQNGRLVDVAASKFHRNYIDQMTMPEAGPDLDVPCNQYADNKGHLTAVGATNANGQVSAFYDGASTTTVTTTTQPPTTTTTAQPFPNADKFIALLRGTAVTPGDVFWWNATYLRHLPYSPNTGWVDGDRCGYDAMYAFLLRDGELKGRVSFIAVPGALSYAVVNDKFMLEAIRWYDGSLAPPHGPGQFEIGDCPEVLAAYEPYLGPGELPTITYTDNGQIIEVRDYKATLAGPTIKFQVTAADDQTIAVVAYENNLPVIVVYYQSISPTVVMESDLGLVGG